MSWTAAPEELEIVKEFAGDSIQILGTIENQVMACSADDNPETAAQHLEAALDDLFSIRSSSEFLDVTPIFGLANITCRYLETCLQTEKKLGQDQAEALHRIFDLLREYFHALEQFSSIPEASDQERKLETGLKRSFNTIGITLDDDPPEVEEPTLNYSHNWELPEQLKVTITPEMVQTYITEADEQLEAAENALLALEKNLDDREAIDSAFRAIHTFKGNSGLFNYVDLERIGHHFESILEDYISGKLRPDQKGITVMLKIIDIFKSRVAQLPEGDGKVEDVEGFLTLLQEYQSKGQSFRMVEKGNASLLGEILMELGFIDQPNLEMVLQKQGLPLGEMCRELKLISDNQLEQALDLQRDRRKKGLRNEVTTRSRASSIRVDLDKLDTLVNLVGELIVAENMITQNPDLAGLTLPNFKKAAAQLNRISRELQDITMSLRMIPIEGTFQKMVRVVRDVSQKQSKQVELVMEGENTEVDKNVVEAINNPLLHIIRNAIDHGIEPPDEREKNGKNRIGSIALRASHEGGEVMLEISDDGRGIDPQKVLAKAREKGLLIQGREPHSEEDAFQLIFEPGFSTAGKVTDISGRGIGMDVVKKNLEAIKGRIQVVSQVGKGTSFFIRIPLTLAIIDGMLVSVGKRFFTIPLESIRETIQAKTTMIFRNIDQSEGIRLRDRLVPVTRLHELFRLQSLHTELEDGIVIIVEHNHHQLGLFVDQIHGQYQTVIKGLSEYVGQVRGVSGTSILSDGDISLILDVPTLIEENDVELSEDPLKAKREGAMT